MTVSRLLSGLVLLPLLLVRRFQFGLLCQQARCVVEVKVVQEGSRQLGSEGYVATCLAVGLVVRTTEPVLQLDRCEV